MNEAIQSETRAALLARTKVLMDSEPNFARFLKASVEATDPEDFAGYAPGVLETLLRQSFDRFGKRDAAAYEINLRPPEHAGQPEIIEIFSANMPFIVDSVLAAIRAEGGSVRFLAHPILDFDPTTYRVLEGPAPGSRLESFLHIHIAPLPDAAARQALHAELDQVLAEVGRAVAGWRPMLERLHQVVQSWHDRPPEVDPAVLAEAMQFLGWLADHNFTFLGMRSYRLEPPLPPGEVFGGRNAELLPVAGSGMGILADPEFRFLRSGTDLVEMTPQHIAFLREAEPLMVTKANTRARVHRRSHMDYIGVKLFDESGRIAGELRILGLFTSMSLATPHNEVPLIRRKIAEVVRRSKLAPASHAGKALLNALDNYPRDELFQISQQQLFEFATIIAQLGDRPRVRVLSRIDRFDNFVSILLFMPRERYDSEVRARIGAYLAKAYDGRVSAYFPSFPEGELVRVHFIIGRYAGPTPRPVRAQLEADVTELTLTFGDKLRRASGGGRIAGFAEAFSAAYQSRNTPEEALGDIEVMRGLADPEALALRLRSRQGADGSIGLKVYHRETAIPLSDRVPMLENFGFRVIDERTYTVNPEGGGEIYIHDMVLEPGPGIVFAAAADAARIEAAILAVSRGEAESDGLNQLTARAAMAWRDVEILRALTLYLKQVGIAYSRSYLIAVVARHADVAAALVALFHALHDPGFSGPREAAAGHARETIAAALAAMPSLDEDRITRRYLNLVEASLRTNCFQRDSAGNRRAALAIKFDCGAVDGMPQPVPYREIFVYAPRVVGLHLRFGPLARGGLRWSDRPEDFRTEVLGLVKTQQVKNAIIVPVGAKGAFVPRRMPLGADRDAVRSEGSACYRIFVAALLDLTDNLEAGQVVPPADTLRRDGDDPYLVVAADKGTASFSDLANAIALERDYWLGDAFASGGSAGYDHKEMGITARGGWEAVKRHFRELDRDIQNTAFTVVGVGDMSGDVFGNGMLQSPHIRLLAAFDHRDIFIDPDPEPLRSLAERRRLYELPRSSWQDYDKALLSKGGGIYPRSLKTVPLFAEARLALGLGSEPVTPDAVISAILAANVDLLWFGGIGTYVRGSSETDAAVGDRANDAVRIAAPALRARVVGEGANLAVTQQARIEYALAGGRINTDAIDNSAGVNSSDLEVNIKVALGPLVRAGELDLEARNGFLASMTEEVAALCLRNNYLQTLALSVAEQRGLAEFPDHLALIEALEARGELNRRVEFLADDATLRGRGRGLTRPELAVLLAYAKLSLKADLLRTSVPDDPYLGKELYRYFPDRLVATYPEAVEQHRLRREVIATVLANAMLNRGGPAFANELSGATSADAGQIAGAYAAARDSFGLTACNAAIDALDGTIAGATQLRLYAEVEQLLLRQTLWFLRNGNFEAGLQPLVERFAAGVAEVKAQLGALLPPYLAEQLGRRAAAFESGGAPAAVARQFAELAALAFATDIVLVADRSGASIGETAAAFFGVLELFRLGRIIEAGTTIVLADRFDRMALDRALANLARAQRDLTLDVLATGSGEIGIRLAAWHEARPEAIDRAIAAVQGLTEGEVTVSRLSVAAGLLTDLARTA